MDLVVRESGRDGLEPSQRIICSDVCVSGNPRHPATSVSTYDMFTDVCSTEHALHAPLPHYSICGLRCSPICAARNMHCMHPSPIHNSYSICGLRCSPMRAARNMLHAPHPHPSLLLHLWVAMFTDMCSTEHALHAPLPNPQFLLHVWVAMFSDVCSTEHALHAPLPHPP
jgi:hypothetical protein